METPVRVIPPLAITAAMLADTNIPERDPAVDPAEWNSGTAYVVGDEVCLLSDHKTYTCIQNGTNKNPATETAYWTQSGYTNRWAMFDYQRTQASTLASPMTFCLAPGGRVNSIGFKVRNAETILIEVYQGTSQVYTETITLASRSGIVGMYQWYFDEFTFLETVGSFNLPAFSDARIYVTISSGGADAIELVACGIGMYEELGKLEEGSPDDAESYSTVTRSVNAEIDTMIPRRNIPAPSLSIFLEETARIPRLRRLRSEIDGAVAFWFGIEDTDSDFYQSFALLALCNRFRIVPFNTYARISLELEEV